MASSTVIAPRGSAMPPPDTPHAAEHGPESRLDEATLVARAQCDPAAFAALYQAYITPIYRYCYRRLGTREAAEDATSVIFERALRARSSFRGGSFRAWLFAIAHNVVTDAYRRKGAHTLIDEAIEVVDPALQARCAMSNQNHRERPHDLAAALDRHWDALLGSGAGDPEIEELDPALAAATRRIYALDAAPSPHPAFASMLWEDLLRGQTAAPHLTTQPAPPLLMRPLPALGRWSASSPRPLSRVAAAILLILLLAAGSAFAALYPLGRHERGGVPIVAPAATPTPESDPLAERLLLDLTLSDLPAMRSQGGIDVTECPPGASSQERTMTSTDILFVAAGPLDMTVSEAPHPIRVMQTDEAGRVESSRNLEQGQDATLETGATLVLPPDTVIDLVNSGSTPARMLDVLSTRESDSSERDGATWRWGSIGMEQELKPLVSLVLKQVTLPAGAMLSVPDDDATFLGAAVFDAARARRALRRGSRMAQCQRRADRPLCSSCDRQCRDSHARSRSCFDTDCEPAHSPLAIAGRPGAVVQPLWGGRRSGRQHLGGRSR